jgi:hypothetical protein
VKANKKGKKVKKVASKFVITPEQRARDAKRIAGYRAEVTARYHAAPNVFRNAWTYLVEHPIFNPLEITGGYFDLYLHTAWVLVDPQTGEYNDEDLDRNTKDIVVLECGPLYLKADAPKGFWKEFKKTLHPTARQNGEASTHDYRLDVSSPYYKWAIIKLAALVYKFYGDDRSKVYTNMGDA